ncbi:uncharacterized protein EAF01_006173 [Botrytis porri]|uniref:Fungal lipase-type domain-containing protein n=1 Tax=Botrytis porri TaxID=87229 RepID=A0A4Z1KZE8_9HELO|nr:uncharacterized protein EAF01_006173 [Botrytis porri]KAF7905652.1 hypothetical protein EAF01_006173 [Botrytis porri]TGO89898.1 hypothetical protein BPOR_0088g00080 [Botrytis porri]
MRFLSISTTTTITLWQLALSAFAHPAPSPSQDSLTHDQNIISLPLFHSLEELARLVDISYCVGTSGISKPFNCASRCDEFLGYELVDTFNTGVAKSDSSGYIVLDHGLRDEGKGRIIVAFRGTYSIANTIADLSTVPQEYIPYPEDPDETGTPDTSTETAETYTVQRFLDHIPRSWPFRWKQTLKSTPSNQKLGGTIEKCTNCTVHTGFYTSWINTRQYILPHLNVLRQKHPEYQLHLVGHSLGGAIAALAALELEGNGWGAIITTFGEPMIGNHGLMDFIDGVFGLDRGGHNDMDRRYRRVTHVGDPVPLLPLKEWGYRSHAGEIYIEKGSLQPEAQDIHLCYGDEDNNCITGSDGDGLWFQGEDISSIIPVDFLDEIRTLNWDKGEADAKAGAEGEMERIQERWPKLPIPTRYKLWQLFFAHRDYFWRLGVCLPGGDPLDWRRPHYNLTETGGDTGREEL